MGIQAVTSGGTSMAVKSVSETMPAATILAISSDDSLRMFASVSSCNVAKRKPIFNSYHAAKVRSATIHV